MSIIVHIGYHRTGTSFLQKNIFPQCQQHVFHGHPEMLEFGLVDVAWKADRSINYEKLIEVYQSKKKYFISFESFIGPLVEGSTLIDLIPLRFQRIFGKKAVKILITIRKQDKWLKSYYAQWVASGGGLNFMQFMTNGFKNHRFDLNALNYLMTYESYKAVFGAENILVLPYELMKENQAYFLKLLNDFSGENFQTVEQKGAALNRSLSGYQLSWMRFLNRIFETQISVDYWVSKRFFNTMKYRMKLQHSNFLRFGKSFSQNEEQYIKKVMNSFREPNSKINSLFDSYDLAEYEYF